MEIYKMRRIMKAVTLSLIVLLTLGALTGCESIEFLLDQNKKYEEEYRIEAEKEGAKVPQVVKVELDEKLNEEVAEIIIEDLDEINLSDELIAADGLIINRELDYENFLGRKGQSIIEELFVVRRDNEHRYGDVLNYNGNKFFCNTEDICYAVFVKKDKVLGIKFPAARTDLMALMGTPILSNEEYQYYEYMDHIFRVSAVNNEVKNAVVAKDFDGLVAYMSSFNEEATYRFDTLLLDTKFELNNKLGPGQRETLNDVEVLHYDNQGIYIMLKANKDKQEVVRVLLTNQGAFGIDIGMSKEVLDKVYSEPLEKADYYLYQYEDTFYSVFFEEDKVSGVEMMTKDETLLLANENEPLSWADISGSSN